ncbi:MAG TPA: hypothetical protein VN903_05810 [Polyangia bacterium]|nr:hypothetical protein [Polyangia bacterium]
MRVRVAAMLSILALGCATAPPATPTGSANTPGADDPVAAAKRWRALTRAKKANDARSLCTPWLAAASKPLAVEGHKCLAQVELIDSFKLRLEDTKEEAILGAGYAGTGVDRAIDHLTKAIALAPEDLSLHLGRLHIAINSPRAADAPQLLADSLERYRGPDATDDWLSYAQELRLRRHPDVGLEYVRVLEKRYPRDHRVVGAVGTFLIALKRDDEGLPYLRRAVELAPDDAIDTWNLGRFHEKHGNPTSAEPLYRRAVSLEKDPARRQDMACNLARFLAAQPATHAEACAEAATQCGRPVPECR